MPRFSAKQRFLAAPLILVPIAVLLGAHSAASWRPQLVGRQSDRETSWNRGAHFLHLSPDGKWLVSEGEDQITSTLWSLEGVQAKHELQGTEAVFSRDSRLIATYNFQSPEFFVDDRSGLKWHKRLKEFEEPSQVGFAADNSRLQYNTATADDVESDSDGLPMMAELLVSLDARMGKEISRKKLGATIWQTGTVYGPGETVNPNAGQTISRIDLKERRRIFSLDTSNSFDRWEVAPDGKHLWVSQEKQKRFDVHDAKTGRKLWSYSSSDSNAEAFNCYPSWEKHGQELATIENNTLMVRDAGTGQIILKHKNNLPAPIVSWAFTKNGDAVYLMDSTGKIFRQRLR